MHTGMYLNAIICFTIFAFSLHIFYYIRKNFKDSVVDLSLAHFWLFVGFTWLLVAIDLIVFQYGNIKFDYYINQFGVQTFVFLQIVAGSFFAVYRGCRKKSLAWMTVVIYLFLSLIGLFFAYQKDGLWLSESTAFSIEYTFDSRTQLIFQIMFGFAIIFIALDFLRNLYYWLKNINLFEQKYFFACLSILIYGSVGYFDQIGVFAGWLGVLFRLAIVLCVHMTYLAYSDKEL